MDTLNTQLFLWLNASSQPSPGLLWLTTLLAEWLIYALPLLLAGLWLSGQRQQREAAVTATLCVLFALGCGQLIGLLWPHPRPFMLGLGHAFLAHQAEASFPSDHATVFFTLGLSLLLSSLRRLGGAILLSGAVVSWSRVYLGVHFPFDMVGALLLAIPSAWLVPQGLRLGGLGKKLVDRLEQLYGFCIPGASRPKR